MDFHMLRAALADLMAATPSLRVAVHQRALALLRRDVPPERMDCDSDEAIEEVTTKLGGSELRELFDRFDRELAEQLGVEEATAGEASAATVEAVAR
jgi:hypothetical protein